MPKKFLLLTAFAALLAACLPATQPTQDLQSQLNTAIAQTMEINNLVALNVQQTLTALAPAASPTPMPTNTPEPTFETVQLITDTPFPLPVLPQVVPAVVLPTQKPYSCYITTQKPKSGQIMHPGEKFDIVWVIVNSGAAGWNAGVDIKFSGGHQLSTTTRFEIPVALAPGGSFKITLDGKAPAETGTKYMAWKVDGPTCYGEVAITVK